MDNQTYVRTLVSQYPGWEGSKVLACLANHPDTDLYATVLELSLQNAVPAQEAENLRYHLAPIRMTDEATLRAIDKRMNQLIAVLADANPPIQAQELFSPSQAQESFAPFPNFRANSQYHRRKGLMATPNNNTTHESLLPYENGNNAKIGTVAMTPDSTVQAELNALIAYRKECTLPTGKIKCFNDDDTKAYWRQRNAIRRLLSKAEKDGHHEAVAYIKAHLKMGKIFRWES